MFPQPQEHSGDGLAHAGALLQTVAPGLFAGSGDGRKHSHRIEIRGAPGSRGAFDGHDQAGQQRLLHQDVAAGDPGPQFLDEVGHRVRPGAVVGLEPEGDVDLAPREPARSQLAAGGLVHQETRAVDADFPPARVERADLHRQPALRKVLELVSETGHAENGHGRSSDR
jgi:hypothetical protein